jgi:hypothetical protein
MGPVFHPNAWRLFWQQEWPRFGAHDPQGMKFCIVESARHALQQLAPWWGILLRRMKTR